MGTPLLPVLAAPHCPPGDNVLLLVFFFFYHRSGPASTVREGLQSRGDTKCFVPFLDFGKSRPTILNFGPPSGFFFFFFLSRPLFGQLLSQRFNRVPTDEEKNSSGEWENKKDKEAPLRHQL